MLARFFSALSERWAARFGAGLGFFAGSVLRLRRGVSRRNLRMALGVEGAAARRVLVAMYRNLGHSLVEFLRLGTWTPEKIEERIALDGFERLQAAVASGRGVVIVTAHFGNWDLLACLSAKLGIPLHVVTRELKGRGTNRAWMRMREQMGLRLHPAMGSASALLAALRQGEVVAFVIDQHMPPKLGVAVPFFGRLASTTDAPAILAARTGAAVHPAFLFREGFERHRLWVGPEIPLAAGPRREAARRSTALFSREVEDVVRRFPEQWIWMHRRWKIADAPSPDSATIGEVGR